MRRAVNHISPAWAKLIFIGICLVAMFWLIPNAGMVVLSDIYSLNAKNTILIYGNKNTFDLNSWLEARAQLDKALSIAPDDPSLLFSMGQLNAMRAFKAKGNKSISKAYFQEAANYYEKSLKIRPKDALTWVNLVLALDAMIIEPHNFNLEIQQAKDLTENEKYLADTIVGIITKHNAFSTNNDIRLENDN